MTFEDFPALVLKEIRDILPSDYASAEITLSETKKLNRTYPALIIRKEESSVAEFHLTGPLTDRDVEQLSIGDTVYISGEDVQSFQGFVTV